MILIIYDIIKQKKQYTEEDNMNTVIKEIIDKKEKEIHIFMSIFLDSNFLQNTAPEEQQDSDICYLLCNLYRIKDDLELCNTFYSSLCSVGADDA